MSNKIKLLSEQVANQIAAGEVIERPASIIKELLENSIDAGSDDITVVIKKSGINYISITDNGAGISKDDLPMAICQHATSKLSTLSDLEAINSLGFRGEALASICAVAKLKIISKEKTADEAWSLEAEGDNAKYEILPAAHQIGTTIIVRDLFFNIPVRRRFLKSPKTEYQHILEIFQKIALSYFNCAFTLISDDKLIYKLPKANNKFAKNNRVKKIFGFSFVKDAKYFEGKAPGISIQGWLSNENYHRSQADQQYFFLNNRVVRDKLILHAIKYVYESVIPNGRYPCYVLYLDLDPSAVDVNVHPTKHEVRFCEPRWVHQFLVQQLSNVLLQPQEYSDDANNIESESRSDYVERGNFNSVLHSRVKETISVNQSLSRGPSTYLQPSISSSQSKLNNLRFCKQSERFKELEEDSSFSQPSVQSTPYIETSHSSLLSESGELTLDSQQQSQSQPQSLGNIELSFGNNFVISKYQDSYYLINLKSAYCYLASQQLSEQWHKNGCLESEVIVIKPEFYLGFLYQEISKHQNISKQDFVTTLKEKLGLIKQLGFDFHLSYRSYGIDGTNGTDKSNDRKNNPHYLLGPELEFLADESGEISNNLQLLAVPYSCRYADYQELLIAALRLVISSSIDAYQQLANFSMARLEGNLSSVEQQAIVDQLEKKPYNSLRFNAKMLAKKLSYADFEEFLAPLS